MTSLGAILTQQWVAGLQRQREDEIRREQLLRQDQQLGFSQMLQSQKSISDLVTAHQQRELQFATAMGQAAQKSGVPMPELKSESANEHGLLGQMMGEAQVKTLRNQQMQQMLLEGVKSQYALGNQQAMANFNLGVKEKELKFKDVIDDENARVAHGREMGKTAYVQGKIDARSKATREALTARTGDAPTRQASTKTLKDANELLLTSKAQGDRLTLIEKQADPAFFNRVVQMANNFGDNIETWTSVPGWSAEDQQRIQAFKSLVEIEAEKQVRVWTGAAAVEAEQARLRGYLPNMLKSYSAFKGAMESVKKINQMEREQASILIRNKGAIPEEWLTDVPATGAGGDQWKTQLLQALQEPDQ